MGGGGGDIYSGNILEEIIIRYYVLSLKAIVYSLLIIG